MTREEKILDWLKTQVDKSEKLENYALTEWGRERATVRKQAYYSVIEFMKSR